MSNINMSIWTIEERKARFGITISQERLETLRGKRIRQLYKLTKKLEKINPLKARRFEARAMVTKKRG